VRKWPVIGFGIVLVLVLGASLTLHSRRSSFEVALDVYKLELRNRGERLTFEELYPTPEPDRTVDLGKLLKAAAQLPSGSNGVADLAVMQYVSPGTARVSWDWPRPRFFVRDQATDLSWTDLEASIDATADVTRELRECAGDPTLQHGRGYQETLNRVPNELVLKREAARWLAGTAVVELHRGRPDQAFECLDSLIALARMHREEFAIVSQMIRVALGNLALSTTWELLQRNGWSDAQLDHLQQAWADLDFLDALERGLLGERAFLLQQMAQLGVDRQQTAAKSVDDYPVDRLRRGVYSLLWNPAREELFYLRHLQPVMDGIRAISAGRSTSGLGVALADLEAALERAGGSLFKYRYTLSLLSLPTAKRAAATAMKTESLRRMTVVAIALSRYMKAHGRPPSSVDLLVPEYLPAVLQDPMSGATFGYRPNPDGSFTLYSVGADGIDDGGDPTPPPSALNWGLWEGRDAVWPSPVWNSGEGVAP
jgi:hypothetical protein